MYILLALLETIKEGNNHIQNLELGRHVINFFFQKLSFTRQDTVK